MRESSRPWAFLAVLIALSFASAVAPVAAQDDLLDLIAGGPVPVAQSGDNEWGVSFPHSVTPGTSITISGRTPNNCVAGSAETGLDPGDWGVGDRRDPRSGRQVSTPMAVGSFSVELDIPTNFAADPPQRIEMGSVVAQAYVLCLVLDGAGGEVHVFTSRSVFVSSEDPAPPDRDPDPDTDDDTDADADDTDTDKPVITDDMFQFNLNPGTAALTGTGSQAGGWPVGPEPDSPFVLAAGPDGLSSQAWASADAGTQAVRIPRNVGCNVSTCLWGYFAPPYYGCNQTVVVANFGRSRYGSMTGYGYVRKGKADYIKARPLFYQDGALIRTGSWEKKAFFTYIGQPWEAWTSLRIHQQFAEPQSTYQVAFQAQWYQRVPWRRDRMLAQTAGVSPIPYTCTAGP